MKFVLVAVFVVALASGLMAGMLVPRLPTLSSQGNPAPRLGSPLAAELNLTPEQNEKMRTIWESTRDRVDSCYAQAQTLQRQRDDAVWELLSDEQRTRYAKVTDAYQQKFKDLEARRRTLFDRAVEETEKLLTPEQVRKYREIREKRLGPPPPHLGLGGPSEVPPTSAPVAPENP